MLWYALGADEIFPSTQIRLFFMKSLYLLVDFFTIIIPLVFSFHPKIRFDKKWNAFLPAMLIVAFLFICWDIYFTSTGVWSFNPDYSTGIKFINLPVEEILFFICIPYACVFTYHCLVKFLQLAWKDSNEKLVCVLLSVSLLILAVVYRDRAYTSMTFFLTAMVCLIAKFLMKVEWFGKSVAVYAFLLIPFLIVNGILTGTGIDEPVVIYNNNENMGVRMLTIPVEDIFYGYLLFMLNLLFYHLFLKVIYRPVIQKTQ
jgi:lycopene cyclase domain-containing protein